MNGQLGGMIMTNTPAFVNFLGPTIGAVSAGGSHTCSIKSYTHTQLAADQRGSLYCWGDDSYGQVRSPSAFDEQFYPLWVPLVYTNPSIFALSERDFDNDGTLNIFEFHSPPLVSCTAGQYGFYMCVDAPPGKYVASSGSRYATDASAGYYVHQQVNPAKRHVPQEPINH